MTISWATFHLRVSGVDDSDLPASIRHLCLLIVLFTLVGMFTVEVDYGSGNFYPAGSPPVQLMKDAPPLRDDTCLELGRRIVLLDTNRIILNAQKYIADVAAQFAVDDTKPKEGFASLADEALHDHEVVYWHHGAGVRYLRQLAKQIGADAAIDDPIVLFSTAEDVQALETDSGGYPATSDASVRYIEVPDVDGWRYRLSDDCAPPD